MNCVNLIKKAFIGGEWTVGYRKNGATDYSLIELDNEGWIADPFLFEYRGEHYLFVEYAVNNKGDIAYYKFINDRPVFQKTIISEPYHLSYPCVFFHNNDIYMIPESADNHTIDLYKSVCFPDKWEKICTLKKGIYYDSTFFNYEGKDYLISYSPERGFYNVQLFLFDFNNYNISLIAEKKYKDNIGRSAGNLIIEADQLLRPVQDCSKKYGESILFYKVQLLEHGGFDEVLQKKLSAKQINNSFQRIHTYNKDSLYETVDFYKEKISVYRPFFLIGKRLKQYMS